VTVPPRRFKTYRRRQQFRQPLIFTSSRFGITTLQRHGRIFRPGQTFVTAPGGNGTPIIPVRHKHRQTDKAFYRGKQNGHERTNRLLRALERFRARPLEPDLRDERYEVVSLLTTCNEQSACVHLPRRSAGMLDRGRRKAIGLPLEKFSPSQRIPTTELVFSKKCPRAYSRIRRAARHSLRVRRYFSRRFEESGAMKNLAKWDARHLFRSGKLDSRELIREFLELNSAQLFACDWKRLRILAKNSLAGTLMKNLFAYCRRVLIRAAKWRITFLRHSPGRFFQTAGEIQSRRKSLCVGRSHASERFDKFLCLPVQSEQTKGFWFAIYCPYECCLAMQWIFAA